MHRKLLGIAIVALLPFTSAFAATGCPEVQQAVTGGTDLKTAMESAVDNGQCTAAEAASAGQLIAGSAAERQIVAAFRLSKGVTGNFTGVNGQGYRVFGGQITITTGFGGTNGGGGGLASIL